MAPAAKPVLRKLRRVNGLIWTSHRLMPVGEPDESMLTRVAAAIRSPGCITGSGMLDSAVQLEISFSRERHEETYPRRYHAVLLLGVLRHIHDHNPCRGSQGHLHGRPRQPLGTVSAALQAAIDKAFRHGARGIVFVSGGRYVLTRSVFLWPGVRLIGYGATRPVLLLLPNTPGFPKGHGRNGGCHGPDTSRNIRGPEIALRILHQDRYRRMTTWPMPIRIRSIRQ